MKKILLITFVALSVVSCQQFLDVNTDPNRPSDVQESLILPPSEINIARNLMTSGPPAVVLHWMQEMAANQPNPQVGTYLLRNADVDGDWINVYVTGLTNLKNLTDKAVKNGNHQYAAVSRILTAFTLGLAADLWGDIPYSQAFQGVAMLHPVYDKQEEIYNDIQKLLDDAIVDCDGTGTKKPASDDYFYQGDMTKWKKLAYTLKARYFMHLTKAPGHTAAAQADLALTALTNGMAATGDEFRYDFPGDAGHENGWFWAFQIYSNACLSSTFVEGFKTRNDPRLSKMVKVSRITGQYTGLDIGNYLGNPNDYYSYPSTFYSGLDYDAGGNAFSVPSTNYMLSYSEALFLKAEATFYKSGFAAAQPIYVAAVREHMTKLGVAEADIVTYLAARGTLTGGNALQRIMEEKSISNFLNVENFTDWRRTGFPTLTKVANALSEIPRRYLYSQLEITSNPQPQQSATLVDHVWWDN